MGGGSTWDSCCSLPLPPPRANPVSQPDLTPATAGNHDPQIRTPHNTITSCADVRRHCRPEIQSGSRSTEFAENGCDWYSALRGARICRGSRRRLVDPDNGWGGTALWRGVDSGCNTRFARGGAGASKASVVTRIRPPELDPLSIDPSECTHLRGHPSQIPKAGRPAGSKPWNPNPSGEDAQS